MRGIFVFFLVCLVASTVFGQDFAPRVGATSDLAPFYHGVASGDPTVNRVMLWTRITPETDSPKTLNWRVALDTGFTQIVKTGSVVADSSTDYTAKVDVSGLEPNAWYYYDFESEGKHSIIGRTRTAPDGAVQQLRFGVTSCSNYARGFFNVYARIGERNDVDAILHLGDYIYEGDNTNSFGRSHQPPVTLKTLDQYRVRYGQYKMDPDLIYLHQQYPWIMVWDDHETGNNVWKDGSPKWGPADFPSVAAAATKAYFEWTPIRPDTAHYGRVYRDISFGPMVELIMLDTRREGREKQLASIDSTLNDSARTILGAEQYAWVTQMLQNSTAHWKVLGQQVMMAPLRLSGLPLNLDQWDGYPAERTRLLKFIESNSIDNVVVLTGDIHQSWASDLPANEAVYDSTTGAGSVAVEFVTPSVASGAQQLVLPFQDIKNENVHLQYAELTKSGYFLLDLKQNAAQADFYNVPTIVKRNSEQIWGGSRKANDGENHLQRTAEISSVLNPYPTQAPLAPGYSPEVTAREIEKRASFLLLGLYPNPTDDVCLFSCYLPQQSTLEIAVYNLAGQKIDFQQFKELNMGMQELTVDFKNLAPGIYQVAIRAANSGQTFYKKLIVR